MRKRMPIILALFAIMLCGRQAAALDPNLTLHQFDHTSWTIRSGAPAGITSLAQTTDGYLWLGTITGLYRFDGVTFELYRPPHGEQWAGKGIRTLYATREGGLWIGFSLGEASLLQNGRVENFTYKGNKLPRGTILDFVEDQDGSIWAAAVAGLGHFSGGKWRRIGAEAHLDSPVLSSLFLDHQGTLWATTTAYLYFMPKGAANFERTSFKTVLESRCVETKDGALWSNDTRGVVRLSQNSPTPVSPGERLLEAQNPSGLLVDRDGTMWVFPDGGGVERISFPSMLAAQRHQLGMASIQHFTHQDGLTSDRVDARLEDREGNIWLATPRGLDRFRRTALIPARIPNTLDGYALAVGPDGALLVGSEKEGLRRLDHQRFDRVREVPMKAIECLYRAPNGTLWLGGESELGRLSHGRYTKVAVPAEDATGGTYGMTVGPDGDLWISRGGHTIIRVHKGVWQRDDTLRHRIGTAVTLLTDHRGLIWAGYMKNVVSVHDGDHVNFFDAKQGLTVGNVTALHESGSQMWVGGSTA